MSAKQMEGEMGMQKGIATVLFWLSLSFPWFSAAIAHDLAPANVSTTSAGWADDPEDPPNLLKRIQIRGSQTESLFPVSPLGPLHDGFGAFKQDFYDATNIMLGLSFHSAIQGATDVLPGTDDFGGATDMDFVGTWELFNRGEPTQGELVFGLEGRWEYGPIGPQNIGFGSLGSAGGTANTFSAYTPAFILRNLYYRQGSPEAGWVFRVGKITPDAILLTNRHITPNTTFLSNAGTGVFAGGFPDSGLGIAGNLYINDNVSLGGVISDSNANRFNWGDIGTGDFYTALELGLNTGPKADKAGHSKFLIWHTDGTSDGTPINGNTGNDGWGYAIVLDHELTSDGRAVVVGRYGQSFDKAAIYDQQAAVHFLLYEPFGRFENDVIGAAFNWVQSAAAGTRDEYNIEAFYRFPLFPHVDTTLSYQSVFNPAFNTAFDHSSVFSLRVTTSF